ncbi:MAG: T9SS type A sorting domain-containing protein [Chloroflexota bacterium]
MKNVLTLAGIFIALVYGSFAQNPSIQKLNVPKDFVANGIAADAQGNLFIATYGMLRSTDKGASWKIFGNLKQGQDVIPMISLGTSIDNLTFTGGGRLYGNIYGSGVYSNDNGATWTSLYSDNPIEIIGHSRDTLYGKNSSDLLVLAPGSQTWVKHRDIGDFDAQFFYAMKNGFKLALGYGEFMAYIPITQQWLPGSFSGLGETRFTAAADIGINLWIGTEDGLFQVNTIAQQVAPVNLPDLPTQTPMITDVISVGDSALFVATASYGVFGSSDLGVTWGKIGQSEDITYTSGLEWLDGSLYISTATGIFRLKFGSSSEVENLTSNADMTLGGVGYLGDKALFASLTELYSGSAGELTTQWSRINVPLNVGIYLGAPIRVGDKLFIANSNFLASWDGTTLTEVPSDFVDLNSIAASKNGTIWALDHTVLKSSTDGGVTFNFAGPPEVPIYYGVWTNSISDAVLVSTDDGLYATEDGSNWGKLQFDIGQPDFTEAVFYGDTIMIAESSGKVYYTETLGASWTEITPDSSADFPFYWSVNDFARASDGTIYMATNVGLFYKANATAPFVKLNKPEIAGMPAYYAGASAGGDVYFGFMNGIYKVTSKGTGIAMEKINQFNFAPNPARETLQILSKELPARVEIYSAAGALQFALDSPGSSINIGSLAPGAYALKLYTGKGVETQMFVKE